ncbi:hypothetical protein ACFLYJ_03045 [Candidatus Cloacimonadota bacterium]
MGQQQIFMVVLSVLIVSAAIVTGISAYKAQAKSSNRNAIIQDMYNIANLAIAYYKTPQTQGGGGRAWDSSNFLKFSGYQLNNAGTKIITDNGKIQVTELVGDRLQIKGWGTEIGFDEDEAIQARLRLQGPEVDEAQFVILN